MLTTESKGASRGLLTNKRHPMLLSLIACFFMGQFAFSQQVQNRGDSPFYFEGKFTPSQVPSLADASAAAALIPGLSIDMICQQQGWVLFSASSAIARRIPVWEKEIAQGFPDALKVSIMQLEERNTKRNHCE